MKAFSVLMLAHFLGDYYFQPQCLAERKSRGIGWVLVHAAVYAAVLAASLLILGGGYIRAVSVCAVTHCAIDVVKQLILNAGARRGSLTVRADKLAFCVDQALHIAIMLCSSAYVTKRLSVEVPPFMAEAGALLGGRFKGDMYVFISYAAIALGVMKPANVFIKKLLATEKPKNTAQEQENALQQHSLPKRTGQLIGSLERLLITALLALRQYSAIAIVFTAKSIARFRQLEDREFAEYYITGTLLSVVTAIALYGLISLFGTV